jgi:cobalt-zinc-cadmium efflux system outer membrane protein
LNIFNKNQGNIKAVQFSIKQQEINVNETELELNNAVQNAMNKLILTKQLSSKQDQDFFVSYDTLFRNITDSYRQRQISLIEFIDFFDAYRDTRLQWLQQQLNLQLAKEELNYQTGKDVAN